MRPIVDLFGKHEILVIGPPADQRIATETALMERSRA